MKIKEKIKNNKRILQFSIYPFDRLAFYLRLPGFLVFIMCILLLLVGEKNFYYDLIFACLTGAVGSIIVTIIIEMSNNYKYNVSCMAALIDYNSKLAYFFSFKHSHKELDVVDYTLHHLHELIPILKDIKDNKSNYLTEIEIASIENVLTLFKLLKTLIKRDIVDSAVRSDSETYKLDASLENLKAYISSCMPKETAAFLRRRAKEEEIDRFVDLLLSDGDLITSFLADYDISQNALEQYKNAKDRSTDIKEIWEDIILDIYKLSFLSDREKNKYERCVFDAIKHINIPSVSYEISVCYNEIYVYLEELYSSYQKKPYFYEKYI